MKNNTNLLIAVVVMISFMFFWDAFVASRYAPARPKTPAIKTSGSERPAISEKTVERSQDKLSAPFAEATVVLKSSGTEVVLQSRGGRVLSWRIKEKNHWVELVVAGPAANRFPLEFFSDLNFVVRQTSDREATLVADHPSGFRLTKSLALEAEPPFHHLRLAVSNLSASTLPIEAALPWGPGLDKRVLNPDDERAGESATPAEMRAVAYATQVRSWKSGFISKRAIHITDSGPFEWAGVDNAHFLAAFLAPEGRSIPAIAIRADRKTPPIVSLPHRLELKPGEQFRAEYRLYVGPKKYADLLTYGHNLDKAVDFGFFGVIAKVLLKTLIFFQKLTGNFGWAIILLTICIQVLVLPLTRKNLQHSLRMKELQPQLKKLQEQFKSDPKRLQIETLNLYKRNGMRFMGMEGCFPMLLQIPIFFAFYATLNNAYELRGAPWILWIKDLGVHDPYYVLPILMGGGMLLQQKMTTAPADPAQARMMLIMPVMFTFMFLKLPAGLVLYWVVNSLVTIAVQQIMGWQKHHAHP